MAFVKSKVFLILEVSFIIVTAISFLQISKKKNSIETEINDLQKERGRALEESRELDKMEQDALSDSYIELEAKRKLGYRKEGETVVVPGKVLNVGELTKKVEVAAFSFSQSAEEKIKKRKRVFIRGMVSHFG